MRSFARQPAVVEELVQEVFVDAYFGLSGYRGAGPFAAWLTRIATHVGYRYWKRIRRSTEFGRDEQWWRDLAQRADAEPNLAAASGLVRDLLDQLPPRDRLALLLVYVEGHSMEEAAQIAGWSKTMMKVQAFRARRKLRALLAKLGISSAEEACEQIEGALRERT